MRRESVAAAVLLAAACETWADKGPDAIPPDTDPTPIVDADGPEPLPDQTNEGSFVQPPDTRPRPDPTAEPDASFIVKPRDPDNPPADECAVERGQNEYWCATANEAGVFDDGDGKQRLGCPAYIIAVGKDRTLKGTKGFPACALGRLEPCETNARRKTARSSGTCCYAIACPTH